jgi:hypothetical protein
MTDKETCMSRICDVAHLIDRIPAERVATLTREAFEYVAGYERVFVIPTDEAEKHLWEILTTALNRMAKECRC